MICFIDHYQIFIIVRSQVPQIFSLIHLLKLLAHQLYTRDRHKLSHSICTFPSDDSSAIGKVLKQKGSGMVVEVYYGRKRNCAVKTESYEPGQDYHYLIFYQLSI